MIGKMFRHMRDRRMGSVQVICTPSHRIQGRMVVYTDPNHKDGLLVRTHGEFVGTYEEVNEEPIIKPLPPVHGPLDRRFAELVSSLYKTLDSAREARRLAENLPVAPALKRLALYGKDEVIEWLERELRERGFDPDG